MSLTAGMKLGAYDVLAPLGAGGMGEVYRARDTRLNRDVAIKVLPASVASDPDRRARFEREAQAVAALSHPNILAIFDTGIHDGYLFAVTELLHGSTLRERLNGGPIPPRKAIEIAIQIARGLSAAHGSGLIHRDLKPENVFLLDDGQVKILDFGLVRQVLPPSAGAETMARTDAGMVMGTIGYMAPEQVRGLDVDPRADLFALGVVLYEMLSGRRAFVRETAADSMTAILTADPPELSGVADLPPALERIVRHALEKNPVERFQTARDVVFALESLTVPGASPRSGPAPAAEPTRPRPGGARWLLLAAGGVALIAVGWLAGRAVAPPGNPNSAIWLSVSPPHARFASYPSPAISPDGAAIAFVSPDERGRLVLWVRRLDSPDARALEGSEAGQGTLQVFQPFWSPDGRSIAFFADGKLKRISLAGGAPQTLADAPTPRGGSWGRDGRILYQPISAAGIYTIPDAGGTPALVKVTDPENRALQYPSFLPDGRHFLVSATNGGVYVGSLDDPSIRKVSDVRSRVEYSGGYLFFEQDGGLYAQPFDLSRLETTGVPVRVAARVGYGIGSFIDRTFSVSPAGRMVIAEGTWQAVTQLTWFDRTGREVAKAGQPAETMGIMLSKDGTRALLERHDPESNYTGPWLLDLAGGTESRLSPSQTESIELTPTLSADESRVFFSTLRGIFQRQLRGGQVERLLAQDRTVWLNDRSADGKYLLFETADPVTQGDVWLLTLGPAPAARPLLATRYSESLGRLSPDGRAVAYVSNENGRRDVFVDGFPDPQSKIVVSPGGGNLPEWRADSRELYYLGPDQTLTAVSVDTTVSPVKVGRPATLFRVSAPVVYVNRRLFQPNASGDRFLVNALVPVDGDPPVHVLLNWPAVVGK